MLKTRVVIADGEELFRDGVAALLRGEPDIDVTGFASSASEAVERCGECRPDVVLMEIGMPGMSSFEAAKQIRRARPETKVLFLTSRQDEDFLIQAMDSGASGYVLKTGPASQLMIALRDVCRGGSYLSPPMLAKLVADFRSRANGTRPTTRLDTLTNREREVLKMLAEGNSVKEIASVFDLSVKTVEAHKFNLMRKLDLHNKAQLVQYAIQKRVISLAS